MGPEGMGPDDDLGLAILEGGHHRQADDADPLWLATHRGVFFGVVGFAES